MSHIFNLLQLPDDGEREHRLESSVPDLESAEASVLTSEISISSDTALVDDLIIGLRRLPSRDQTPGSLWSNPNNKITSDLIYNMIYAILVFTHMLLIIRIIVSTCFWFAYDILISKLECDVKVWLLKKET